MRIILSPAKQMIEDSDTLAPRGEAPFRQETEQIKTFMQGLTYEEAKKLWGCNDKLATQNFERFASMDLSRNLTPAVLAYDGIAYKYMAPGVFEFGEFDYVQEHLRILSAFYGVLRAMDGVVSYRLEMQAKAKINETKNLYEFWGDKLYREVMRDNEDRLIVNLASAEYSKCIEKYLTTEDRMVTCIFGEMEKGKIVQKGVYAKMARGEMVRFMAEKNVSKAEEMTGFDRLGYHFREDLSDEASLVFLRS